MQGVADADENLYRTVVHLITKPNENDAFGMACWNDKHNCWGVMPAAEALVGERIDICVTVMCCNLYYLQSAC